MSDPWDDPQAQAWARDVETNMVPMMRASAMVTPIYDGEIDAKLAVEVGAAVLLDKPLVIIVMPGIRVPEKFVRVADRIIEGDLTTDEGRVLLSERIRETLDEFAREGRLT